MSKLSHSELARYGRHLLMPEVGMEGQAKLKQSSVLIIGAGGLGSPLGQYLAAAGVGHIGMVDFDDIELSNLQRQVLFTTDDVGKPKVETAIQRLQQINPLIQFTSHPERLTSENALDILKRYDVIVDGTDNFPTRYLVNDACVLLKKPLVYGSIYRFDGQVSVFDASGPCYRCLFPTPPPPDMVPSCAEGGVLGVLPGIIGSLQALEALKLLLGTGGSLIGRLILFDALNFEFNELKLRKRNDCPICGDNPTINMLIDYEAFCMTKNEDEMFGSKVKTINVAQLQERMNNGTSPLVLDVRNEHEYTLGNIGAELIPLAVLPEKLNTIDKNAEIVVHCRSGKRSLKAAKILLDAGFKDVTNLTGGLMAWAKEIDPSVKY
ncbi:MAG: molybdopterin-synthase adenylyltransferase MoeB [Calditrichia bacterium]